MMDLTTYYTDLANFRGRNEVSALAYLVFLSHVVAEGRVLQRVEHVFRHGYGAVEIDHLLQLSG